MGPTWDLCPHCWHQLYTGGCVNPKCPSKSWAVTYPIAVDYSYKECEKCKHLIELIRMIEDFLKMNNLTNVDLYKEVTQTLEWHLHQ